MSSVLAYELLQVHLTFLLHSNSSFIHKMNGMTLTLKVELVLSASQMTLSVLTLNSS